MRTIIEQSLDYRSNGILLAFGCWHVMLPMARPGLITVAIFLFLGNYRSMPVLFHMLHC